MKFNIAIINGKIIDGTGNPWFKANIGIKNGRIEEIRRGDLKADVVIDAEGLMVCPGFIDLHSHSDMTILVNNKAE